MKKVFYFAYGSNTNKKQIFERLGYTVSLGNGYADNFEFSFDENINKNVYANIRNKKNSKLFGHLYRLTEEQMNILDYYEGSPYVYKKININVYIFGEKIKAFTYVMTKTKNTNKIPSKKYFNVVSNGYCERDLPLKQLGDVVHENICIRYVKKWIFK